jgi:pimeloyl-ACP methyl ester carboxylesterase
MRTTVTMSDGARIAVRGYGGSADRTGRTFLLLHGLMGRASTWWRPSRWLADHGRVLALDARGHGDTTAPTPGPWPTERFVADAAEVLDNLDTGPVVIIGHSMGGLHGWELAAARPDLVERLVVEDMAPDHRGRTAAPWVSWFAAMPEAYPSVAAVRDAFGHPRASVGDYFAECVREDADGYRLLTSHAAAAAIAGEWGERDFWPGVRAVRCPTLLLEAAESPIASEQMAEMAAVIPDARHVRVPGTGHLLHDDAPDRYRALVTEFVLDGFQSSSTTDNPTRGTEVS